MNTASTIIIATMEILRLTARLGAHMRTSHTLLLSITSMVSFRKVEA